MLTTPADLSDHALLKPMIRRRCLITGASGFLGRSMLANLLAAGADVHYVVHRRPAPDIPHGQFAKAHQCDLVNLAQVEQVFATVQPEYVFHLATARGDEIHDRDTLIGNFLAADHLVRASLRYRPQRIVVAGSSLEYGPRPTSLIEDFPARPNSLHGATKAAATLLFQQAALSERLPVTILRVFSIYGYWEPAKRLIPTAMRAALERTTLPLTVTGLRRDFIFVSDVIEAFLLAAQAEKVIGEIINIGSGQQTSNEDVVSKIMAISGRPIQLIHGVYPTRATDTPFWRANLEKARHFLDWTPRHDLDDGLRKTWRWFCENSRFHA